MKGQFCIKMLRIIAVVILSLCIAFPAFAEEWGKHYPNNDLSIVRELDQGKKLIMMVDYNTLDINAIVLDASGLAVVYGFLYFLFYNEVKKVGVWDLSASEIGQPWVYLGVFEMPSF